MRSLATVCLGLVLFACGGHAALPSASAPAGSHGAPPGVALAGSGIPASAIRRSVVQEALSAGPGAFLQELTVDDHPVFLGGKFHGFRIAALRGDAWTGVDLRPGDVVLRVNGFSIEHPEDAAEAFYSLRVASELRVEYERDGELRELRFGIFDDVPLPDAGTRQD